MDTRAKPNWLNEWEGRKFTATANETGRTVEGMKFVCQREDQGITKSGLNKWNVIEESVHFIMERRQQQNG